MSMDDLGILSSNYVVQMMNELYLYNLDDCFYYGFQVGKYAEEAVNSALKLKLTDSLN